MLNRLLGDNVSFIEPRKILALSVPIVGSLAVGIIFSLRPSMPYEHTFPILLVELALFLGPLWLVVVGRRFDPFEPIYLWIGLYAYMYFLRPLVRMVRGQGFWFGDWALEKALLLAALGLAVFYVGYYVRIGQNIASSIPLMPEKYSFAKLRRIAWLYIVIGALGLIVYMNISGGWRTFWSQPHGYGGRADLTTGYIYMLPELMVTGFFLLYFCVLWEGRVRLRHVVGLGLGSLGGVGVYAILWGSRTTISWVALTLFSLPYLRDRKRPKVPTFVLGCVLVAIALSFTPVYRRYMYLGADVSELFQRDLSSDTLSVAFGPKDEFDSYLAEVALIPTVLNYDYFRLYAYIPLHFIPRLLWPGKPVLFITHWDQFLLLSGLSPGAAMSVMGDFYAQLGLLGIVIGMFFSGVLWRMIYAYPQRAPENPGMQLLFAVALPNMVTYIAQSARTAFWKWIPLMVPSIVFALLWAKSGHGKKETRTDNT